METLEDKERNMEWQKATAQKKTAPKRATRPISKYQTSPLTKFSVMADCQMNYINENE